MRLPGQGPASVQIIPASTLKTCLSGARALPSGASEDGPSVPEPAASCRSRRKGAAQPARERQLVAHNAVSSCPASPAWHRVTSGSSPELKCLRRVNSGWTSMLEIEAAPTARPKITPPIGSFEPTTQRVNGQSSKRAARTRDSPVIPSARVPRESAEQDGAADGHTSSAEMSCLSSSGASHSAAQTEESLRSMFPQVQDNRVHPGKEKTVPSPQGCVSSSISPVSRTSLSHAVSPAGALGKPPSLRRASLQEPQSTGKAKPLGG
ncbi:uncharacterized protein LOC134472900 [Cavia porcellus]|uniref:uncharacterized protein LOC134472900 n=1 Tax=Cavia porcellus TaxID=10141 RepID=UPI002FE28FF7